MQKKTRTPSQEKKKKTEFCHALLQTPLLGGVDADKDGSEQVIYLMVG